MALCFLPWEPVLLVLIPHTAGEERLQSAALGLFHCSELDARAWFRIYILILHVHLGGTWMWHHFTGLEQRLGQQLFYNKFSQMPFTPHLPSFVLFSSLEGAVTDGELFPTCPQCITTLCAEEFAVASFITGHYQGPCYSKVLPKDLLTEIKRFEYLFAICNDVSSLALKALLASFIARRGWFYSKFKTHCWYELDTNFRSRLFLTLLGSLEC